MDFDRVDRSFNARFYRGEVIALAYQFVTGDVPQDATGRTYRLAILNDDATVYAVQAAGTMTGVTLAFDSTVSSALYGYDDLTYQIAEVTGGGYSVIVDGRLTILPSAALDLGTPSTTTTPLTVFTRSIDGSLPTVSIETAGGLGNVTISDSYSCYPSGDTTGFTDAAVLKPLMQGGLFRPFPGTYYIRKTLGNALPFASISGKSGTVDWGGSTLVLVWDPAQDGTPFDGVKNPTLGRWFDWLGGGLKWINMALRMSPDPTTELTVTAINLNVITCRCLPGRGPAWQLMGAFGWVPDLNTGSFTDWNLTVEGGGSREPLFTITPRLDLGSDYYDITLPRPVITISSVAFVNPNSGGKRVRITVPSDMALASGMIISLAGVGGCTSGGVSVLNGKKFRVHIVGVVDNDDGTGSTTQIDLWYVSQGTGPIRVPSDTTDWTSGGTITGEPPIFLQVGGTIAGTIGKTRGGLFLWMFTDGAWFDGTIESCGGIAFWGKGNRNARIRLNGRGAGLMSINAGPILFYDSSGKLDLSGYSVRGAGDAHLALNATALQQNNASGQGANSLTVPAWASLTAMDVRAPRPVRGQRFSYFQPSGITHAQTAVVDTVTDTSVTFVQNHPGGYDYTTWKLVPLPGDYLLYADTMILDGGWTAGLTIAGPARIGFLLVRNIHAEALRVSLPGINGFSSRNTGPAASVWIGVMVVERCGYNADTYRQGVITGKRSASDGTIAPAPADLPPVYIGHLIIDHYGFAALSASGVNFVIGTLTLLHGGEYRANSTGGVLPVVATPDAQNDVYVENASVTIGAICGSLPTLYKGPSGVFSGPAAASGTGSGYPSNGGTGVPIDNTGGGTG